MELWWSGKHEQHGGNVQVITAPDGWPLWTSDVTGTAVAYRGQRRYLGGVLPVGDAFLTWSLAADGWAWRPG